MKWQAALLSLQVALVATILLTVTGLGLAIWLTRSRFRGKVIVETLVNLPLVLPPSVIGYYLLLVLGRGGPLVDWFGWRILFTLPAAVVASALMGLPLMVGASRAALSNIDPALENAGRVLGSTEPEILWRVTLPLARRGILAGVLLGSARALGEFGATLMVAGNIPGRTQTLPLAIYDAVQNQDYVSANRMVLLMTILAFMTLLAVRFFERPAQPHTAHWESEATHV
jgi:molybdate transport system permease protein